MNSFIDYLNSTNNSGGNTAGSLAEFQVKSQYFAAVRVDRKIGSYITKEIKNGNHKAYILTGFAGDGKTSILAQVLYELGYLETGSGLKVEDQFPDFQYVKDMSEITTERQASVLEKSLSAPKNGKTSLLISNTGPLLRAFAAFVKSKYEAAGKPFTSESEMSLQSKLLTQLDSNKDEITEIEGYKFVLLNIARVDNVSFAVKILKNILALNLWEPCGSCFCARRCPIKNNHNTLSAQFDRVALFIDNYYRFLFENDKRMTIRQMVSQLSFAITGNLTCEYIKTHTLREPFFNYNFANLFFGYRGLKFLSSSDQIESIRQIKNFGLDSIALDVDYELFVARDLSCFSPEISNMLTSILDRCRKNFQASEDSDDDKSRIEALRLRRAIRRFYLMYSLCDSGKDLRGVMDQVFGKRFSEYKDLISEAQNKSALKNMRDLIFEALYARNTGFLPGRNTELQLTLRRDDDVFQNVMIILGKVERSELNVVQKKRSCQFEDTESKQELILRLKNTEFGLTFPMINYFSSLIDGAIASDNNPALSHGIAKLDALLLEKFRSKNPESTEECELSVLINTVSGQEIRRFEFDGNRLDP